ncbi:MAG: hypothetical protein JWL76_2181 [Thermoleophilia bacterium]|nr:hypothetical protein [Thermoleophilia bacterium]
MQLSPTTAPAAPVASTGPVLGTGIVKVIATGGIQFETRKRVDITAGATLMSGIRDVQRAAQELIRRTWEDPIGGNTGLVGFVRHGDTFDAVEMLAPTFTDGSSPRQVWAPWNIAAFRASADLAAVWQVSPYGGDAHLGQPGSMFPTELPVA